MNKLNDTNIVKKQYENASKLNTRISIHEKYSTNKLGFGNWIFSNYRIENDMKILEIGCGTGNMWMGKEDEISKCSQIILSDFSEGILATAKSNLSNCSKIDYQVIDIQSIPFEDHSFDVVIANMMLYHVPDIFQGLKEVKRVMKENGTFYCATYGEHGIIEYLSLLLSEYGIVDDINKNFTLQNGKFILETVFGSVTKKEYEDSLAVTDIDDMVEYIYSLTNMTSLSQVPKEQVENILLKNTKNGILNVPKEYGMFICQK